MFLKIILGFKSDIDDDVFVRNSNNDIISPAVGIFEIEGFKI